MTSLYGYALLIAPHAPLYLGTMPKTLTLRGSCVRLRRNFANFEGGCGAPHGEDHYVPTENN